MYPKNSSITVKIGLLIVTTLLAFKAGLNETPADTKKIAPKQSDGPQASRRKLHF